MRKLTIRLVLVGMTIALSGCYEDMGVTLHEPGEYKGKKDPLVATLKQQQMQESLEQRFKTGQTDR
ncbi:MAG: hypothetical protein SV201_12250 [Pseudomonadota bacterium]|nr:hypothetical protein [Pseudomonadota bacterium]